MMNRSEAVKLRWQDPEYRRKHIEGMRKAATPEHRQRLSESIKRSWQMPERLAKVKSKKIYQKVCQYCELVFTTTSRKAKYCGASCSGKHIYYELQHRPGGVLKHTKETKAKISETMKAEMRNNPEHLSKWIAAAHPPNKLEMYFQDLLPPELGFRYVGSGQVIINGLNPDFINEEDKIIIELFGDYWHKGDDATRRIALFAEKGYKTLIVWEHQVKLYPSLVVKDILNYCKAKGEIEEGIISIPKIWGSEEVLVNNSHYCGKFLKINKGATSSLHAHRLKQETFFCKEGTVCLTIKHNGLSKDYMLTPFVCAKTILPRTYHQIYGVTDAVIIEISTPWLEDDVVRLSESVKGVL